MYFIVMIVVEMVMILIENRSLIFLLNKKISLNVIEVWNVVVI